MLHCAVLAGPHRASAAKAYEAILSAQGFGGVASSARHRARSRRGCSPIPHGARAAGEAAARGAATLSGAVAHTVAVLETLLRHARA